MYYLVFSIFDEQNFVIFFRSRIYISQKFYDLFLLGKGAFIQFIWGRPIKLKAPLAHKQSS